MMQYKGHIGKVEFDDEEEIFHGEICSIAMRMDRNSWRGPLRKPENVSNTLASMNCSARSLGVEWAWFTRLGKSS